MSWLQRLTETYDACFGMEQFEQSPLPPLSSVSQKTQLHITLWEDGTFCSAKLDELESTTMFVTEDSAGRSGTKPSANPLTEQLEYCAKGIEQFGGDEKKFPRYISLLTQWTTSGFADRKVAAVLTYVETGTLLDDLLRDKVITVAGEHFTKIKISKTTAVDPAKLWVRWSVNTSELQTDTWSDQSLALSWAEFDRTQKRNSTFCMATGELVRTTQKHPRNVRRPGDSAKLISTNDETNYTYRGRFTIGAEALTIGYETTQKAHNALRWLIARQGTKHGDQVIVSWSTDLRPTPSMFATTAQILGFADPDGPVPEETYEGDAGQSFALQLRRKIHGYRAHLGDRANVVVMALDSATPGRMAILYYRELKGSEFLDRIERWHAMLAWHQNFGKDNRFLGAPAPRDIAEAAYGRRVDEKLRKATVERLLPCIVDGRPLPLDLERATVARAVNRVGMERWEFERVLGIACSLVRATNFKEYPTMSLDEQRTSRDYLYGRLLAVADNIEELALRVAHEDRETNAARLMQRFADHPHATWRTLELQLRPYIARLRSSRAGALAIRQKLLDTIVDSFPTPPGGESSFADNRRLSGEFLLGFHSQRQALRAKKNEPTSAEPSSELSGGEDQ